MLMQEDEDDDIMKMAVGVAKEKLNRLMLHFAILTPGEISGVEWPVRWSVAMLESRAPLGLICCDARNMLCTYAPLEAAPTGSALLRAFLFAQPRIALFLLYFMPLSHASPSLSSVSTPFHRIAIGNAPHRSLTKSCPY